ncbi:RebB family R body protein [Vibrio sp. PP-XX7]
MDTDIQTLLDQFAPTVSRNMHLNVVAASLGRAAENATQVQQQLQSIVVSNSALSSGLIYAIAAKSTSS